MCAAWIIAAALGGMLVGVIAGAIGLYAAVMYQCHNLEEGDGND